jgi:hypothetical protein
MSVPKATNEPEKTQATIDHMTLKPSRWLDDLIETTTVHATATNLAPDTGQSNGNSTNPGVPTATIAGISVGVATIILAFVIATFLVARHRRKNAYRSARSSTEYDHSHQTDPSLHKEPTLPFTDGTAGYEMQNKPSVTPRLRDSRAEFAVPTAPYYNQLGSDLMHPARPPLYATELEAGQHPQVLQPGAGRAVSENEFVQPRHFTRPQPPAASWPFAE